MNLFGIRRNDREHNRDRDRRDRTRRNLTPAVEGCERRLSLSGIVGNHIGVVAQAIQGNHIGMV